MIEPNDREHYIDAAIDSVSDLTPAERRAMRFVEEALRLPDDADPIALTDGWTVEDCREAIRTLVELARACIEEHAELTGRDPDEVVDGVSATASMALDVADLKD